MSRIKKDIQGAVFLENDAALAVLAKRHLARGREKNCRVSDCQYRVGGTRIVNEKSIKTPLDLSPGIRLFF